MEQLDGICVFCERAAERRSSRPHGVDSYLRKCVYLFTSPEARGGAKRKAEKPKTHLWMVQTGPNDAVEFGFHCRQCLFNAVGRDRASVVQPRNTYVTPN